MRMERRHLTRHAIQRGRRRKTEKKKRLQIDVVLTMKTLKGITATLETLKPFLSERFGVETIGVFGSYTRGEQTKKSDIDILVTLSQNAQIGFFKFLELEEFLTKKLGVKVDLVTKNALKPYIKDRVLRETVYA